MSKRLCLLLLVLPAGIPVLATLASLLNPVSPHWPHLLGVVLPRVVGNTALLLLLVVSLAGVIGTGFAWLTTRHAFPLRGAFHVLLLLPLAMPGYVLGFVAIEGLDYSGPVQTAWRALSGQETAAWEIRGVGGAGLVLGLTLYPYVYLVACNAFGSIHATSVDVAASLGERRVFRRIALPLARPWIAGALLLVAMETLADFGTVALFNVDTFTTAIYKSWFGFFSVDLALQLASVLVLISLLLTAWHARQQRRRSMVQGQGRRLPRLMLGRGRAALACLGTGAFVMVVVGVPVAVLVAWSLEHLRTELDPRYLLWLRNSLLLALITAALLTAAALLLAYIGRTAPGRITSLATRVATLGYALPGALIAVGVFAPLAALEAWAAPLWSPGWVTQGFAVLLVGYAARFLAVAHTPVAQQLRRLSPSLDESARLLNVTGLRLLSRVHAPLVSGAVAGAAALVLIDVIKEMPITLMTRPFGWDTLATRVFELTAEGEYRRAALPALSIVMAGLVPVALILRGGERRESAAPEPLLEGLSRAA